MTAALQTITDLLDTAHVQPSLPRQKICLGCDEVLPMTQFPPSKNSADGYAAHCSVCQKTRRPRRDRIYTYQGHRGTLKALSAVFGQKYTTVWNRMHLRGETLAEALERPAQWGGKR